MTLPNELTRSERDRLRYASDPAWAEKKRAQSREWGRRNAERNRQRAREWQLANPAAVAKRQRDWYVQNRETQRNSRLKGKYGITAQQYDKLLLAQNGVCAICRNPETTGRWNSLSVDHCHDTGLVRGLLCNRCNRAIGLFRDSGDLLQAAAGYLWHSGRKTA